ncbi:hypothetical protein [Endozoicomonas ascidiicola]|nr:hypothetical protein [Endozoicomonas ascidiicola]USN26973.1 hypothetical protein [synthetic construct]
MKSWTRVVEFIYPYDYDARKSLSQATLSDSCINAQDFKRSSGKAGRLCS